MRLSAACAPAAAARQQRASSAARSAVKLSAAAHQSRAGTASLWVPERRQQRLVARASEQASVCSVASQGVCFCGSLQLLSSATRFCSLRYLMCIAFVQDAKESAEAEVVEECAHEKTDPFNLGCHAARLLEPHEHDPRVTTDDTHARLLVEARFLQQQKEELSNVGTDGHSNCRQHHASSAPIPAVRLRRRSSTRL